MQVIAALLATMLLVVLFKAARVSVLSLLSVMYAASSVQQLTQSYPSQVPAIIMLQAAASNTNLHWIGILATSAAGLHCWRSLDALQTRPGPFIQAVQQSHASGLTVSNDGGIYLMVLALHGLAWALDRPCALIAMANMAAPLVFWALTWTGSYGRHRHAYALSWRLLFEGLAQSGFADSPIGLLASCIVYNFHHVPWTWSLVLNTCSALPRAAAAASLPRALSLISMLVAAPAVLSCQREFSAQQFCTANMAWRKSL